MRIPRRRSRITDQRGGVAAWLLVLIVVGILAIVFYAARRPLLRAFADWWVVDEPLETCQAIVVLGGDSVLGDRVRHAIELYRRGRAPRVVLSGPALRTYFSETELMEREATNLGLPKDAMLVLPHNAESTLEEALVLRRFLTEHDLRRVIAVTSNVHTRRARTVLRAVLEPAEIKVWVSSAPDVRFDPRRWWERREGRAALLLELLKLPHTWWELEDVPEPEAAAKPATGSVF